MLKVGDQAPVFILRSDSEEKVSLNQFRGKKVILYFYPRDNTPGCTQQACDFRDQFSAFDEQQAVIIGISKDGPLSHRKFKQQYKLPFILLSDENGKVCEAYGVMNPKTFFGRTFIAVQRTTFLIDENGIIQNIWRKVKVPEHVDIVLNHLDSLTTS